MNYYNRGEKIHPWIVDFYHAAFFAYGDWSLMREQYLHPTGVLGLQPPEYEWHNVDYPWWAFVASFIRHWIVTFQQIKRCLWFDSGWCKWEDNYSYLRGWAGYITRPFYVAKAITVLLFAPFRRSPDNYYDAIEVAGWDFGTDYWGEAQGQVLKVGHGIFKNWFAWEDSI